MSIEKEFIPYEEALVLKELGFDEPCLGWFKNRKFTASFNDLYMNPHERGKELEIIKAPLFSQAFRWFREKYKMAIISPDWNNKFKYKIFNLHLLNQGVLVEKTGFNTYEEAELACLKKLIEIVQGGNK